MKKLLLASLGLHLALLPCFADVVPSKYDDKDPASRKAVQTRLEQIGTGAAEAETRVKRLTNDEIAYFAQNPERVQAVGGIYWYEWLGGVGVGLLLIIIYFSRVPL
jgi:hypothetical protein